MGDLFGLPEWAATTGFVVTVLIIFFGMAGLRVRKAHRRLATRRPNPTEAEFLAMMTQYCSSAAAQFTWDQVQPYVEPRLTPHPEDLLIDDLCIDDDDIVMDWPRVWAEQQHLAQSDLPDWPKDWPLTVRNFALWLDMGRPNAAE